MKKRKNSTNTLALRSHKISHNGVFCFYNQFKHELFKSYETTNSLKRALPTNFHYNKGMTKYFHTLVKHMIRISYEF